MSPHFLLLLTTAWAATIPQRNTSTNEPDFQTGLFDNYSLSEIKWSGFEDFDKDQVFTGTIQDVVDQMRQIKGSYYTPSFVSQASNQSLEAEPPYNIAKQNIKCGGALANPFRINEGVSYLHKLPDTAMCTNSPRSCGRISCSWRSGIYWCNDKDVFSDAYKCSMFGDYASLIVKECATWGKSPHVAGMDRDSLNRLGVVVKKAPC
ncbi:hypothetical protein F4824DRAFT_506920 [Ustulina deusta]|nr:hypothetical protein F4824DRAFT_506920 [Ustulina deusta]